MDAKIDSKVELKTVKPLHRQRDIFYLAVLFLPVAIFIKFIQITAYVESRKLEWSDLIWSSVFYKEYLTEFSLPVGIVGALCLYVGFKALLTRSILAENQNELSRRQVKASEEMFETNRLNEQLKLYLEHRNYVYNELERIESSGGVFKIYKPNFYETIFPENSQNNFKLQGNIKFIEERLELFNSKITTLNEVITKKRDNNIALEDFDEQIFKVLFRTLADETRESFKTMGIVTHLVNYHEFLKTSDNFEKFISSSSLIWHVIVQVSASQLKLGDYLALIESQKYLVNAFFEYRKNNESDVWWPESLN